MDLALTKPLDASVSDARSPGALDLRERQLKVAAIQQEINRVDGSIKKLANQAEQVSRAPKSRIQPPTAEQQQKFYEQSLRAETKKDRTLARLQKRQLEQEGIEREFRLLQKQLSQEERHKSVVKKLLKEIEAQNVQQKQIERGPPNYRNIRKDSPSYALLNSQAKDAQKEPEAVSQHDSARPFGKLVLVRIALNNAEYQQELWADLVVSIRSAVGQLFGSVRGVSIPRQKLHKVSVEFDQEIPLEQMEPDLKGQQTGNWCTGELMIVFNQNKNAIRTEKVKLVFELNREGQPQWALSDSGGVSVQFCYHKEN